MELFLTTFIISQIEDAIRHHLWCLAFGLRDDYKIGHHIRYNYAICFAMFVYGKPDGEEEICDYQLKRFC